MAAKQLSSLAEWIPSLKSTKTHCNIFNSSVYPVILGKFEKRLIPIHSFK